MIRFDSNPVYRKSKTGGAVVKFVARNEGYVIDPGDY